MKRFILFLFITVLVMTSSVYAELVKSVELENIYIQKNGVMDVKTGIVVKDDGVEISRTSRMHRIVPGDDTTNELDMVKVISSALWTPELINEFLADETGQPLTLNQQKSIKMKKLYSNIKYFTNYLPDGMPRYDADLKMGIMNAIMEYTAADQPIPASITNAKTWLTTVQGLFVTQKAAITAAEDQAALDAINVSIANLESQYGKEGTVLADPGVSTADLVQ